MHGTVGVMPKAMAGRRKVVVSVAAVAVLGLVAGCAESPAVGPDAPGSKPKSATTAVVSPNALAVDGSGNVYIADLAYHVIDKVTPTGSLSVVVGVAGNGGASVPGKATKSPLSSPSALAVDAAGDLYLADSGTNQQVDTVAAATGVLSVVAGATAPGTPVSSGPALASGLSSPSGLALDSAGDLYIADSLHGVVEKVDTNGLLSIVAGKPGIFGPPTAGPATDSSLYLPTGVAVDSAGDVYIADTGNGVVEKVDTNGTLSVVAGQVGDLGTPTEGPATDSSLGGPTSVAVDAAGELFIADPANQVVEEVADDGSLSIVAGQVGTSGRATPGAATTSDLNGPSEIAVDPAGDLYIADTGNNQVQRVSDGTLSTIAGSGSTTTMTTLQTAANTAIEDRLQAVHALMLAVNSAAWLTSDHRTSAQNLLQSDYDGLLALGKKLTSDTTVAATRTDYQSIYTSYRIFALALQQVQLEAAADDLLDGVAPQMTDAYNELEALLDGPDSAQDTPALRTMLADLQTQIGVITAKTTGLSDTVAAYTPAQYNPNRSLLKPAKAAIAAADAAAAKGAADISALETALGTSTGGPSAVVQASLGIISKATDTATRDLQAAAQEQAVNDQPANIPGN